MSKLPAKLSNLATGLATASQQAAADTCGQLFMKFTKFGEFMYGATDTLVEEESTWVISSDLFAHGWIGWGNKDNGNEGELFGEEMTPASTPMPPMPAPIAGAWNKQAGMILVCLTGEDEGVQCVWKGSSKGYMSAWSDVVKAVVKRINEGHSDVNPVVELDNAHYTHRTYGKIFTPQLKIVSWAGESAEEAPAEVEQKPEETKPVRRRKRA
jgi:hypothetical protein